MAALQISDPAAQTCCCKITGTPLKLLMSGAGGSALPSTYGRGERASSPHALALQFRSLSRPVFQVLRRMLANVRNPAG